jgi:hypothetical protein
MFRALITFTPCYREIPLYFGKHSIQYYVVPCECALLLWTIFSVYRDHISPLKAMLAYRLFEQVHHTIHMYTGYQQHYTRVYRISITHLYTRYQHYTRLYRVSITHVYTRYQQHYTCVYRVSITHVCTRYQHYTRVYHKHYTFIHGINNTVHAYTGYH